MVRSFRGYWKNNFFRFLCSKFNEEAVRKAMECYCVGTSDFWDGACIFWQVDSTYRVRTGKIMLYDANNGHRVKNPRSYIAWVHKMKSVRDFNLKQCLFGEHLLIRYEENRLPLWKAKRVPSFVHSITRNMFGWPQEASIISMLRNAVY